MAEPEAAVGGGAGYLGAQDVPQPLDGVVVLAARLQGLGAALFEAGKEVAVVFQKVLQLGEDPVHAVVLQLQALAHLVRVHAQHDPQRAHLVHLRLDQLCGGGQGAAVITRCAL